MKRTFETALVEQCAPTLRGIKPASLFRYQPEENEDMAAALRYCALVLREQGITVRLLKVCRRTGACLVYLYWETWLCRILAEPATRSFLRAVGYGGEESCNQMLRKLSRRLCLEAEYPHEIGVFLGYPLEDVQGFIRHRGRNYTCSGLWKAYGDPVAARRRFDAYRRCTAECVERWKHGSSLAELMAA